MKKLGVMFALVVGVLVVFAMIPTIADKTDQMRSKYSVVNETINLAPLRNSGNAGFNESLNLSVAEDVEWPNLCPHSNFVLYNQSNATMTSGTDYTFTGSTGKLTILDSDDMNSTGGVANENYTYVDYTYCQEGYIVDSAGRTMARLILIFAGLAIVIWVVYVGLKEWL